MTQINLELNADDVKNGIERGDIIVVIDVLRASCTIITALRNGALGVMPVKMVEEAKTLKKTHPDYVLGGEREGLRPEGFELGNSPLEYTTDKIGGKRIILTMTSGTQALTAATNASMVRVRSFLNSTAVANAASDLSKRYKRNITIALAGKLREFSLEDFLCGGAIIERIQRRKLDYSDAAYAALLAFKATKKSLTKNIFIGKHAKELVQLGFSEDVNFCSSIDRYEDIPILQKGKEPWFTLL